MLGGGFKKPVPQSAHLKMLNRHACLSLRTRDFVPQYDTLQPPHATQRSTLAPNCNSSLLSHIATPSKSGIRNLHGLRALPCRSPRSFVFQSSFFPFCANGTPGCRVGPEVRHGIGDSRHLCRPKRINPLSFWTGAKRDQDSGRPRPDKRP